MSLVVDASIVAAWLLEEADTPAAEAVVDTMPRDSTWVPQLFPIEVANVLLVATKRGRVSERYAHAQLDILSQMPFQIDDLTSRIVWQQTYQLARSEGLTVYDATYLELAERRDAVLATLDADLAAAAKRRGLTVIP